MEPFDIVGIGGANVDICGIAEEKAVPGDSNPGVIGLSAGGVCRNICENAVRMGASASLISLVGEDLSGDFLLRHCRAAGMNVSLTGRVPDLATGTYLSVHSGDGEMVTAVNDMRVISRITPEYLSGFETQIERARAILIDGNLPQETLNWIGKRFSHRPIFADPVSRAKAPKLKAILPRLFLIKPNLMEAQILTGETSPEKCAEVLHRMGVKHVAVSCGAEGVCYCGEQGSGWTRPKPLQRFPNATGAGDSLMAGLLVCWSRKMSLGEALAFAVTASVLTLQSPGTICRKLTFESVLQKQKECLIL